MPSRIQSDPLRLRQILINLIGNAIKFSEVGEIRCVARLLAANSNQPSLQVEVVDPGIGMTEAQMAELFKPFSQVDSSTTRKHGGTGLGLTISKRLAEKLGGDITVTSAAGAGSTFSVRVETGSLSGVPLLEQPDEICVAANSKRPTTANQLKLDCRVLLVEDGPDNQRLIAFILKKCGAEVVTAPNGMIGCELALEAAHAGTAFDVILMDMQMPVLNGYDATAQLRSSGYTGSIIALTAHAMSTDRQKCLSAGCDDYATKPIDRAELVSLVDHYTSAHRGLNRS